MVNISRELVGGCVECDSRDLEWGHGIICKKIEFLTSSARVSIVSLTIFVFTSSNWYAWPVYLAIVCLFQSDTQSRVDLPSWVPNRKVFDINFNYFFFLSLAMKIEDVKKGKIFLALPFEVPPWDVRSLQEIDSFIPPFSTLYSNAFARNVCSI